MLHMCVYINIDGIEITAESRNSQNYVWFNLTGIQEWIWKNNTNTVYCTDTSACIKNHP